MFFILQKKAILKFTIHCKVETYRRWKQSAAIYLKNKGTWISQNIFLKHLRILNRKDEYGGRIVKKNNETIVNSNAETKIKRGENHKPSLKSHAISTSAAPFFIQNNFITQFYTATAKLRNKFGWNAILKDEGHTRENIFFH